MDLPLALWLGTATIALGRVLRAERRPIITLIPRTGELTPAGAPGGAGRQALSRLQTRPVSPLCDSEQIHTEVTNL